MEKIEIVIGDDGMTVSVDGVKGERCVELTNFIGKQTERSLKPEYYETIPVMIPERAPGERED